ncbi:hypothetical protein, partial [Microcoleus sp. N9_A1]|uniref:hypothetical protein n=1 Tax=Microcoleus sp. N9_A1 TaxID=3055380 RepID=UPI002FCE7112
ETKIIMGIVVASHTYPDPGCELEPEPEPEPELPASPNPRIGIDPLSITDTGLGYVLVGQSYYSAFNGSTETFRYEGISEVKCTQIPEVVIAPQYYQYWTIPVILNIQTDAVRSRRINDVFVQSTSGFSSYSTVPGYASIILSDNTSFRQISFGYGTLTSQYQTGPYPPSTGGIVNGFVCFGSMRAIAKWVIEANKPLSNGYPRNTQNIINQVIPVGRRSPLKPGVSPLKPGVPPHMDNCCEEVLDILEELREVLVSESITKGKGNKGRLLEKFVDVTPREKLKAKTITNYADAIDAILSELQNFEKILHGDFFHDKKFPVPTNLLIPGAEGSVEATSYYHLVKHLFQSLAHGTIINPVIAIQDTDSVKEGDQTLNSQYLSATGWAEAVTKMLYEIVDDGNVGTNMDIRTGVTVTQLLVAVAHLSHQMDCVIDCIGVTTKRAKGEVETSYNLVLDQDDKIKGFDPKKANKPLDLNDDTSTEKLLSSLLKTRKNPIVKEEIHPKASSLVELLEELKNKQ